MRGPGHRIRPILAFLVFINLLPARRRGTIEKILASSPLCPLSLLYMLMLMLILMLMLTPVSEKVAGVLPTLTYIRAGSTPGISSRIPTIFP